MDERKVIFSNLDSLGQQTNIRTIKQSDILQCPFVILISTHYRDNGSCKCDDLDEQRMMIEEWGYTNEDFESDVNGQ